MAPVEEAQREEPEGKDAVSKEDEPEDEPIVKELKQLDDQYLAMEREFEAEERALRAKFRERQQPLLQQRAEILAEPAEVQVAASASGTPVLRGFWCKAIDNHPAFKEGQAVKEWDVPVLEYLKDITTADVDENNLSFRLDFIFAKNPYFEETVLSKGYIVRESCPWSQESEVQEVRSTNITWKQGMDVTVDSVKKKVKGGGAKKSKAKEKNEPRLSFFRTFLGLNLAAGAPIPSDCKLLAEEIKHQLAEEGADGEEEDEGVAGFIMERDLELGSAIRENVIPYAVRWFTGEACDDDLAGDDEDATFKSGDRVEILGLESEAGKQLNGKQGKISHYIEDKGRFHVELGPENFVSVRPTNLRRLVLAEDLRDRGGQENEDGDEHDDEESEEDKPKAKAKKKKKKASTTAIAGKEGSTAEAAGKEDCKQQ